MRSRSHLPDGTSRERSDLQSWVGLSHWSLRFPKVPPGRRNLQGHALTAFGELAAGVGDAGGVEAQIGQ